VLFRSKVIDLGVATTPTAGLMVRHHSAHAGLVITASHNPAQWNGFKAIDSTGAAFPPEKAARFVELFDQNATVSCAHDEITSPSHDQTSAHVHVSSVLDAVGALRPIEAIQEAKFKIVIDSVNASGVRAASMLSQALGCELVHIHADESGVFPHTPEPIAENLGGLCDAVKAHGAIAGFAQDPDADRLAVVDERGVFIGEEYTLVLCAMSVLSAMPKEDAAGCVLVANLSTSRMLEDVAAMYGARVARSPVGEANVVRLMREHGSVLAGEGNGGVIWPAVVSIRDSISTLALVLSLLAETGSTISELVARIPSYAIVKRKTPIQEGLAERAMDAAKSLVDGASIDMQDGVRIDFDSADGGRAWLHVRASNTEPILRLIAEAPSADEANEILDRAEAAISAS